MTGSQKLLIDSARETLAAEQQITPRTEQKQAKAALTERFRDVRNTTLVIAKRIMDDIDAIVRHVRFAGWQQTSAGEREVKQALRRPC